MPERNWMDDVIVLAARQGFTVRQLPDGEWVLQREGIFVQLGETPEGLKALQAFLLTLRRFGVQFPGADQ